MNKTIEISRELAERLCPIAFVPNDPDVWRAREELRALLAAPVVERQEPVAYMRNEGTPNNLVKCTFTCPGAFGVYRGPQSLSAPPAPVAVQLDENVEFEKWWCRTSVLRKGKLQIAQEAWEARACIDKVKELNQ